MGGVAGLGLQSPQHVYTDMKRRKHIEMTGTNNPPTRGRGRHSYHLLPKIKARVGIVGLYFESVVPVRLRQGKVKGKW
jgi:hypothetical protein